MGQDDQGGAWGNLSATREEPSASFAPLQPFRVGKVLADTFSTFFGNFFRFWLVSLVVMLPIGLGFYVMGSFAGNDPDAPMPENMTGFFASFFATMAWALVSISVMMSAVMYGAVEFQAGRRAPIGDMIRVAVRSLIPVTIAVFLSSVLYMIGWMLFVIPGVIIAMALFVVIPAIVAEKLGPLAAMKRSHELTSGYKWSILGSFIVMVLVAQVVNFAMMMPLVFAGAAAIPPETVAWITTVAGFVLIGSVYGFLGSGVASVYTNLRAAKEGTSVDDIAKVFQ